MLHEGKKSAECLAFLKHYCILFTQLPLSTGCGKVNFCCLLFPDTFSKLITLLSKSLVHVCSR